MSRPRFSFFDAPKDVFDHADEIEIKLHRIRGELAIEFKVSGGYWPDLDDDDDEEGGTCQRPDSAELAGDLLRKFVAAKGGAA